VTFAHLLAAALLVCSAPALAQNQQPPASPSPENLRRPAEPWRILPRATPASDSSRALESRVNEYKADVYQMDACGKIISPYEFYPISHFSKEQLDDRTCYAIRSYVVARDSKDSDSTHPTGYSTCRPSDRYQVKSAEIRVESPDR
jgi:hypothetical protein